eukprot:UC1_evm3s2093
MIKYCSSTSNSAALAAVAITSFLLLLTPCYGIASGGGGGGGGGGSGSGSGAGGGGGGSGGSSSGMMPPPAAALSLRDDATFLPNWMGVLAPVIANQTLLDLSLPGTHDSMTYDLSTTFSDGANDLPLPVAWVLHEFRHLAPGAFVRNQSKTQGLSMRLQLENGVRFIDFRNMWTSPPNASATAAHDWYCLHMMESNGRALAYLTEARDFLREHPSEILVLWFSRHGSQCLSGQGQYPGVSPRVKQAFWAQVEALFDGMLMDSSQNNGEEAPNRTTYAEMVATGRRVVAYTSDYSEFTGNSTRAIDACAIDNQLGTSMSDFPGSVAGLLGAFATANITKAQDKARGRFYLKSLAAGPPDAQITYAAEMHFVPATAAAAAQKCAALFNVPGMTEWCPTTLQDGAQLQNYYSQAALDAVITHNLHLPHAIYINAVAEGGAIRTGTALFSSSGREGGDNTDGKTSSSSTSDASFAYVDTFALYNVRQACAHAIPMPPANVCAAIAAELAQRRAMRPMRHWSDPTHGRLVGWPNISGSVSSRDSSDGLQMAS